MKPKFCAYCRNHSIFKPEKGHRNKCPYNVKSHLEKCKECKSNKRKTLNTQKHRERKSKAESGVNGIDEPSTSTTIEEPNDPATKNENEIPYDDSDCTDVDEEMPVIKTEFNAPSQEASNQSSSRNLLFIHALGGFKLQKFEPNTSYAIIIMPQNYPFGILTKKESDYIENLITDLVDLMIPSNDMKKIYEKGCLKVSCSNKTIIESLLDVKKFKPNEKELKVLHENQMPRHIRMSCNITEKVSHPEFLKIIKFQNKLDTSEWIVNSIRGVDNEFKVHFSVDLLSAGYIHFRNFCLDWKKHNVVVKVLKNGNKFLFQT
ncbi:uncharacterized protein [Chironomus tepperi]|uniref:uncharacterized protein n=1 Tax=Chironomus tepperi TaxID=113505 RepID=UPI00391F04AC